MLQGVQLCAGTDLHPCLAVSQEQGWWWTGNKRLGC